MKLYNQTRQPLRYDNTSGDIIEWKPFGSADVPERLVVALKEQGFPVKAVPVPPEVKATAISEDARNEQRSDQVEQLKGELATAKAEAAAGQRAAEEALAQVSGLREAVTKAEAAAALSADKLAQLELDKAAVDTLLAEMSKKLESAEARAAQAEAIVAELSDKKPKK